jgi:hypothetical protein
MQPHWKQTSVAVSRLARIPPTVPRYTPMGYHQVLFSERHTCCQRRTYKRHRRYLDTDPRVFSRRCGDPPGQDWGLSPAINFAACLTILVVPLGRGFFRCRFLPSNMPLVYLMELF